MKSEKKERVYEFRPYGPFELPVESDSPVNINDSKLSDFWVEIEKRHKGLPESIGCYIFAIRTESNLLPWYVGKTERKNFRFESLTSHKLQHYHQGLMKAGGGIPLLYLIPRLTETGALRKSWKSGSPSVGNLEDLLIATALSRNPHLLNKNSVKHHTHTVVPGYMNEPSTPRSPEATQLAELLGTGPQKI